MNFKDSNYYKIYADIWNFHKQFCEIKTNDEYWQQVVGTAAVSYTHLYGLALYSAKACIAA